LALVAAARADWIELKNGQRLEGTITSVTAERIVINAKTSMPGITDQKNVLRSEVANFDKTAMTEESTPSLDGIAFSRMAKELPPMTADSAAVYDDALQTCIQRFFEEFPKSNYASKVRQLEEQLKTEKEKIEAGEIKADGQWISAQDAAANPAETKGRLQLGFIKQAAQSINALGLFEKMEKQSSGSSAYPEAVEIARLRIADLQKEIPIAQARLRQHQAEQKQGLTLAREDNRALIQKGITQEQEAIKARLDTVKQSGVKWIPLLPDEKALTELSATAAAEGARLAKLDTAAMKAGIAAAKRAEDKVAAGEGEAAKASLAEAQKLWPTYAQLATIKQAVEKLLARPTPSPTPIAADKTSPQ